MNVFVFGTRGFPGIQGGVEKHCEHLYSLLSSRFSITVFRRKPYINQTETMITSIRFIDLPSTKIKGVEAALHSFFCTLYCIINRPDLIHIHNIGPGMFIPLLKLFRLKVILTYHSPNYEHKKWNKLARIILKQSEWLSTRWADKIIFVNNTQKNKFNTKTQKKSFVIPNGVDFKLRSESKTFINSLHLTPQKYILFVGRITQEKGLDYLIDAFIEANPASYKLVIAGGVDHTSSFSENIRHKVVNTKNIIMTGYVDGENLRQLYSHARLFILPSYNEGFPLVLLEALSYGLDILASNISANQSLNLNEDDYFQVGSVTSLKQQILFKLTKSFAPRSYDIKKYSWESVAEETQTIFESLL